MEKVCTVLRLHFDRKLTDTERRKLKNGVRYELRRLKLKAKLVAMNSKRARPDCQQMLWVRSEP